jgi:hypothetical protein
MVVKFTEAVDHLLELDEYHEFVQTEIDLCDFDCLCESAPALKALANNRKFLGQVINRELETYLDGGKNWSFNANSIILFKAPSYTIRANIWAPLDPDPQKQRLEATAYSYFAFHDHNFHFVTAGYLGSGYESVIYRHEFEKDRGELGAAADLRYVERTRLRQGDVMVYRAFADVHAQQPPDEVSVSLNLMAHPPEFSGQRQYFFDMETRTIATAVSNGYEAFGAFIRMARHVGDANTLDPLMALAQTHSATAIREAALEQLLAMSPDDAEYFLSSLGTGRDPRPPLRPPG